MYPYCYTYCQTKLLVFFHFSPMTMTIAHTHPVLPIIFSKKKTFTNVN